MKTRVLICRCESAGLIDPQALVGFIEALKGYDLEAVVVGDLCKLCAMGSQRLRDWADQGDFAVAACYPRAVRWMLDTVGVTLHKERGINLRSNPWQADLERLIQETHVQAGTSELIEWPRERPIDKPELMHWIAWYPVIDQERCIHCGQCMNFCLFHVYGKDEQGRLTVARPEKCKTNCPACARVCPRQAIIFPRYGDAPFNGDRVEEGAVASVNPLEALRQGSSLKELLARRMAGGGAGGAGGAMTPEKLAEWQENLGIPDEVIEGLKHKDKQKGSTD